MKPLKIKKTDFRFENQFSRFELIADGGIELSSPAGTNLFSNPITRDHTRTAPIAWLNAPTGNFSFGASVSVNLVETFDCAGLVFSGGETIWGKLLHEMSPEGDRTIVTVLASPYSDDCNGPIAENDAVKLRISRVGDAVAMHWGFDDYWQLARLAPLPSNGPLSIGLIAHSSLGKGCTARFSTIFLGPEIPSNMRNGE